MKKLILISLFFLPLHAFAKPYFAAASLPPTLLPAPLPEHSAPWEEEVKSILALQKKAYPAEVKQAEEERNMKAEFLFAGNKEAPTRAANPRLFALLDRVGDTSYGVTDAAKEYFHTKRPYLADPRIKALVQAHDNPSYPSGHTSGSYVWAYTLGLLMPQESQNYLQRAEEIAQHRVLVGMHYPQDVEAGKKLALLIMGALTQNPEFQRDMAAAKAELRQPHAAEKAI